MARRRSSYEEDSSSVNLTPLIDVVFVVLIMFIVVAPLLELDRIELAPAPENPTTVSRVESSELSIQVNSDNSISLNGQALSLEELRFRLKEAHEQHPEKRPQLMQDRRAQFGIYQEIKNAAEAAGFHELDILLKPV